ncbi:SCO-spondin [Drosophila biarmipes]|uniref:SCO-spondin n=1 Tax=Drosophila biarmipes TaxID=125945 RepID=UPI0007E7EB36|nr:SCO-spondin [Drosophila biarmipes]
MLLRTILFVILGVLHFVHTEIPLIDSCHHNSVKVKCKPVCPKLCSNHYFTRRCVAKKCKAGCACKKGWLLTRPTLGYCIPRSSCKRYIIE